MPRTNVRDAVRRFRETNSYTRRSGQGQKRCTTARDDRFMVSNVLRNSFISASELRSQVKEVRNVTVSLRTVRRRLAERNLKLSGLFEPHNFSLNTKESGFVSLANMPIGQCINGVMFSSRMKPEYH